VYLPGLPSLHASGASASCVLKNVWISVPMYCTPSEQPTLPPSVLHWTVVTFWTFVSLVAGLSASAGAAASARVVTSASLNMDGSPIRRTHRTNESFHAVPFA
jgi:hypothetical protein